MPRESASWGKSSSSFRRRGDSIRAASWGTVASGGDGRDSTCDGIDRAEVGRGSAWGNGGDSTGVVGSTATCAASAAFAGVVSQVQAGVISFLS